MIKTKEEIFLVQMGIHTQTIIEGDYTAKYKLKDLLKKYAEQCNIANVSNNEVAVCRHGHYHIEETAIVVCTDCNEILGRQTDC